jgi:hypothetical protein
MEDILAITFILGGGTLIGLSFTPLGRALADRIRHGAIPRPAEPDPVVYEELERVRQDLAELNERVDFTERMLTERSSAPRELGR